MAETLRLETNIPQRIAFQGAGRPFTNQYGDSVIFSLVDGRSWFAPPFVAKRIADAGIRANDAFEVCKRERKDGNRRTIDYEIDLAPTSTPGPVAVPARVPAPQPTHQDVPARGPVVSSVPELRPNDLSAVEFMKLAGRGAIDAVVETESYARSKGMTDFVFDPISVQKILVTLYFDLRKGGRA